MSVKHNKVSKVLKLSTMGLAIFSTYALANPLQRADWTANDYWEHTQLSFNSLVGDLISDSQCKVSIKKLVACVAVVNKMHQIQNPESKEIITVDLSNGIELINTESTDFNLKQYLIALKSELSATVDPSTMPYLRSNISQRMLNFTRSYLTSTNDSYTAAQLYNTYQTVAVDPHSYIAPQLQTADSSKPAVKSKGLGIGLETILVKNVEKVLVTDVFENSPAQKSGLLIGDVILAINEVDTFKSMINEIRNSDVLALSVLRDKNVINLDVEKGYYSVENVVSTTIKKAEGTYGYIKLRSFMDSTACKKIKSVVKDFKKADDFKGLVLDLRNNGGGLVTQATCIMEVFLEPGAVKWMTREIGASEFVYQRLSYRWAQSYLQNFHSAILINGYSASASEALSMYLQDYEKAFIVGERSFGKGSMQSVYQTKNPNFGSHARGIVEASTAALYYGPKGMSPQVDGVTPDIEVYPKVDQDQATPYMREGDQYAFPILDREVDKSVLVEDRRVENVERVQTCLGHTDRIEKHVEKLVGAKRKAFDLQLASAIEVLRCANDNVRIFKGLGIKTTTDFKMYTPREMYRRSMETSKEDLLVEIDSTMPVHIDEMEVEIVVPEFSQD